jgi:hypothetical protein
MDTIIISIFHLLLLTDMTIKRLWRNHGGVLFPMQLPDTRMARIFYSTDLNTSFPLQPCEL